MSLIKEQDAAAIREQLAASLTRPVQLALFVSAQSCSTARSHVSLPKRSARSTTT